MPAPMPGTSSFQATLTSMTDAQLRQTIHQLSTAVQQSQYSMFRPPNASTKPTATFEPKQWSATPPPKAASRQRNRATRAGTTTGTATPTPAQNHSQINQQYAPQPIQQASTSAAPHHPQYPHAYTMPRAPLPTRQQAKMSSYASLLKTGATLLVQPILASTAAAAGGRTGTRRGGVINYAEPGSGDELDGPDAGEKERDSDDSDFVASGGTRTAVRASRVSRPGGFYQYTFQNSHQASPAPQGGKSELDQSYLGQIPPARFILPRKVDELTAHEYPSQEILENQALKPVAPVPIRVEFETDTHRVRDCFVWDMNDDLIKPDTFARIFCDDLDLPRDPWTEIITNQIRAQLEEYEAIASLDLGSGLEGYASIESNDGIIPEVPECRVILSIDVQIATYHLMDHIEWDLLSPLTPEAFAIQLCSDIGLTGEAAPLIAHAMHEEILKHKKDAIEWGMIGGDTSTANGRAASEDVGDRERRDKSGLGLVKDKTGLGLGPGAWGRAPRDGLGRGPRALKSVWKDWNDAEEYAARFEVLTAEEVERREVERERASRRLRRETSKFQFSSTRRRR